MGALALLGGGCGTDTICGDGTIEVDGTCVPTADVCGDNATFNEATGECEGNACATGTTLVDGECVPDGTVVCGDGTSYDPASGTCVPDITECAAGTVLVDGVCIPYDDSLTADVQEQPEPNGFDGDNAGQFTMPEVGENVTIMGCVDPYEDVDDNANLDPDFDAYYFAATGPTLLQVTVDGLNGLSGGFAVLAGDQQLADDGWQRLGLNIVDDVAARQIFLPKAGVYALGISDGRSVLTGEGFGGADTCYYATVERLAIPAPTPFTDPATGVLGDVKFYSYDVGEGTALLPRLEAPSEAAVGSLVIQQNSTYRRSVTAEPALAMVGGFHDIDQVVFVVDHMYSFSLSDVAYSLTIADAGVQALPTDGSGVTVTHSDQPNPVTPDPFGYSWFYFDVATAGDLIHAVFDFPGGEDVFVDVFDKDFRFVDSFCYAQCQGADEWAHLAAAGRYYVGVFNAHPPDVTPPATYELESTLTERTPATLTLDVAETGDSLPADDLQRWYRLDVAGADWIYAHGDPASFDDGMRLDIYLPDTGVVFSGGAGLYNLTAIDQFDLFTADDEVGRIVRGSDVTTVLVRVTDGNPASAGGFNYDLELANRTFTEADADETSPVALNGIALASNGTHYYLVNAPSAGYTLNTSASAASGCLELVQLEGDESEVAGDYQEGDDIVAGLTSGVDPRLWVAYAVRDYCDTTTYDFAVDADAPRTYTATAGTLAYADACDGGANIHEMWDGFGSVTVSDDAVSYDIYPLPFAFDYYGTAVDHFTVDSNGMINFTPFWAYQAGSDYFNTPIPDLALPNALVAPLWNDHAGVTVCIAETADSVTIQWTGYRFGSPATTIAFQVVLHDDSSIDFIYGAQVDDGSLATIGIEDNYGYTAEQISYDLPGSANPGTSWTLTQDP